MAARRGKCYNPNPLAEPYVFSLPLKSAEVSHGPCTWIILKVYTVFSGSRRKVLTRWAVLDQLELMQQLGVVT